MTVRAFQVYPRIGDYSFGNRAVSARSSDTDIVDWQGRGSREWVLAYLIKKLNLCNEGVIKSQV